MRKPWIFVVSVMAAVFIAGCATSGTGGKAMSISVKREAGKVWLAGLEPCHSMDNAALLWHHCLAHFGSDASVDWVVGGPGYAFVLNIHDGLCQSGPTRWQGNAPALARNVGCKVTGTSAYAPSFDKFRPLIWQKVRQAIDAGHPVIGWELDDTLICGYDEEGNYLYFGADGEVRRVHHKDVGDVEMGWMSVLIVEPCRPADDRKTVRDALLFALDNAAGRHREDAKTCSAGIAGYNAWIAALNASDKPSYGRCAFNAAWYGGARQKAHGFLKEAKKRLADKKLDPLFDTAIEHYGQVAKSMTALMELFPLTKDTKIKAEPVRDTARLQKAVRALTAARDAEAEGLAALKKLAVALGAQDPTRIIVTSALPPVVSVGRCVIREEPGHVRLTSPINDNTWARTVASYATPIRIRIRARTDSTNIRVRYGIGFVIFNWEHDPDPLVIGDLLEPGEANEHYVGGKGHLAVNQWHDIVWEIGTDETRVLADGELLYTQKGRFASLQSPVSIGPAWGSTVDVASLTVEPLTKQAPADE